jgi:hypothetical protein
MSKLLGGDTSKTAVSQCAETNRQRDVLTKQVKAGQQTVVATEPRRREGGSLEEINGQPSYDPKSGVQLDTLSLPKSSQRSPLARLRRWYFGSVLRLLIQEFRSLPPRMARSIEIRSSWHQAVSGSVPLEIEPFSVDGCHSCRRAYSLDMRRLEAAYPFLSIFDLQVATQMYLAGARRAPCICRIGHIPEQNCSSAYPEGGNSMRPLAVQQPTPLPSQE